ncbi:DUF11 domain-containing protein, partial [bacterium]|nr:DUF11 domain-containing protein [bacterium]
NNNTATGTVLFSGLADLVFDKIASVATATPGVGFDYTLSVLNNGPSTAFNVVMSDVVPAGVSIVNVSANSPTSTSCNGGVPGNGALPTTCNVGPLASGEGATMVISVLVDPSTTGTLVNNASASSDTEDPNTGNNTDVVVLPVAPLSDITVSKTSTPPGPIAAGDLLSYLIVVTNNGPSDATHVTLFDDLPPEVIYQSFFVDGGGTCDDSQVGELSCSWGLIPAGAAVNVNIEVQIDPEYDGGDITNYVEVNSDEDPDVPDDSDTDVRGVDVLADIWVEKDVNFPTGNPSGTIIFFLTAHNNDNCAANDGSQCGNGGPSEAENVVIVDTLPSTAKKLVFEFASVGCLYDRGAHAVTCDFGTLEVGEVTTKQIQVRAKGNLGLLTNTAEISSDTADPDPTNNTHSIDFLVQGGSGDSGGPGGGRGRGGGASN